MSAHCFPSECGWWHTILALGAFLTGTLTWYILTKLTESDAGGYQAHLKKLCIAAQNDSTLTKVMKLMDFLPDDIEVEKLKLENGNSKPDFNRINYILCCPETSGRGIILSDNNEPDQLGAITTHAENARAHCAILLLGTEDPKEGELYDKSQLDVMVKSQRKLKDFMAADTLFSFEDNLNASQKNAILAWLRHKI